MSSVSSLHEDGALRERQVSKLTSMGPRTIMRKVAAREFPPPRRLGTAPNSPKVWLRSEVMRWLQTLPTDASQDGKAA